MSLFQFDLDKKNEANKRYNHKEGQENSHIKVLGGLLKNQNKNTLYMYTATMSKFIAL